MAFLQCNHFRLCRFHAFFIGISFALLIFTATQDVPGQDRGRRIVRSSVKKLNKRVNRPRNDEDEKVNTIRLSASASLTPTGPQSAVADQFGITPPIRDMPEVRGTAPRLRGLPKIKDYENNEVLLNQIPEGLTTKPETDPLAEKSRTSALAPQAMPTPALTFSGILSNDLLTTFLTTSMPPDTVGDVGPNHYVQATNMGVFRIFNKSGAPLTATARINTLFSSLVATSPCRMQTDGDPVVNYDPFADRWVISQFAVSGSTDGQCIAVSTTADPTGSWYAYFFQQPNTNFPDYPHWGVWTDGYYLATHDFNAAGTAYVEGSFWAFDRTKMLAGDATASYIRFSRAASYGHMPADIDGYMPPVAGTPEMFFEYQSNEFGEAGGDGVLSWEFVPNFTTPASSTFTVKPHLPTAAFDPTDVSNYVSTRAVMEQPQPATASSQSLDGVGGRNMFRVGYRNLGTLASPINSYVSNWNVNVSGVTPNSQGNHQGGIRWVELRRSGAGTMSVFDQGTHAPDAVSGTGRNRWMGSIAQDNRGNLALGFTRSGPGAAEFPDMVWAGRTGGIAAAGTMNEGEATVYASTGVQNTSNSRWGDYSSMTIDPVDDCTFWFTSEWRDSTYNGTGSNNPFKWSTRVANFKFPSCTAQPKGQIAANITSCATGLPISGATVTAYSSAFTRTTGTSGTLASNLLIAPGTYTVTVYAAGYVQGTTTVNVIDGSTSTATLCLSGPTAANSIVSGRILTPTGAGLRNAAVNLTDANGLTRSTVTGPFGYYRFDDVASGVVYTVSVNSKQYTFAPRIVSVGDDITDLDFVPIANRNK